MKKKLYFLLMIAAISAILIGFIYKPFSNKKPKIVVLLSDVQTPYWRIVKGGAEKGFQDFGLDGKVVAPAYGSKKDAQDKLLDIILKEKPDVLVVSPISISRSILQKYIKKKIAVVLIDTDINLKNKTAFIGTDNFELGRKAGELLVSQLQPGDEVALLAGHLADTVFGERIRGVKSCLEATGVKIVDEKVDLSNDSLSVIKAFTTVLRRHPDIKGVYATTDIMALGALDVLEKQGYKIPVIGSDGIPEMDEKIANGTLIATVAQNPYDMGYISVETSLKVIKGENVQKNINTGVDIVSKDNAQLKLDFLNKSIR